MTSSSSLLLQELAERYGLLAGGFTRYPGHEGGRNAVYRCGELVLRVAGGRDRTLDDYLAETEYVHYLALGGADTVDVIPSCAGRSVEQVGAYFATAFTVATGDQIAAHGYRYREGAPLSEYFHNTGRALGKIHALSKQYHPVHRRFDFFERYNEDYLARLIPGEYGELRASMVALLRELRTLPKEKETYGMVHFDFSDGNYNIDYQTGKLTVFDFENCRTCFYLFDLANLWAHGVGWIAHEPEAKKRKAFMDDYFRQILEGYREETDLPEEALAQLPLMIQTVLLENIIDEFEVQLAETGTFENDEEQAYRMKCMIDNIPFMGFFDGIYQPEHPFTL